MNDSKAAVQSELMTTERIVGQRIHAFSNKISGHFYHRTEQPTGVTLPEWRVLRAVLLTPGISQGEIAADQGLNVMNVSRAVGGLRRKRLVDALPDDEDRRRTLLYATEIGSEIGADIGERERMIYDYVFSSLSRDELNELDGLLARLNTLLSNEDLPETPPTSREWATILAEILAEGPG